MTPQTIAAAVDAAKRAKDLADDPKVLLMDCATVRKLADAVTALAPLADECERLRDKHNPLCDAVQPSPEGVVKPCNCLLSRVAECERLRQAVEIANKNLELLRGWMPTPEQVDARVGRMLKLQADLAAKDRKIAELQGVIDESL